MWPFANKDTQRFNSKKFERVLKKAVNHLNKSPKHSFEDQTKFNGNGVYAIYYDRQLQLYDWFTYDNFQNPIYVGKAVPRGWRSSRFNSKDCLGNLQKRICEHATSINQANNLSLSWFFYKYIILNPDLIVSVEAEAIRNFKPLWNIAIEGFGNHSVGRSRLTQAKSEWDILHPGRHWADEMVGDSEENVVSRVKGKINLCLDKTNGK